MQFFLSSSSFPDLCCLLQLTIFILEQLLPSYSSSQVYCNSCSTKAMLTCSSNMQLIVQAHLSALHHTFQCPCITSVRDSSLLRRVVLLFCNDNLNQILRKAKNAAALHPKISARDTQIKTVFQKAGNE